MPHTDTLEGIRQTIRGAFAELGASEGLRMSEHILIRNDLYCGRRFRCGTFEAVWFIEENQIKIHGSDGTVVRVLPGSGFSRPANEPKLRAA
jgi:hypothetical protein